ncbi:MAG TPA: FAD-dependent oxidoreductase [Thermoanaerobaculia bacterium]|nr:FAD-dependent oxidoreductase [Thermoanaerobaculia bacterium]
MSAPKPHIAILGSGPVGLEAALAAASAGCPFTLYEAGPKVAAHVRSWGHVRLFTPWEMNVSQRMRQALEATGREVPEGAECPTGRELVDRLLAPVAALPTLSPALRLGTRVVAVGREGLLKHEEISTPERGRHPFHLLLSDAQGNEWTERADVVLDATGTYGHPNRLGNGGILAPGERALGNFIRRDIPDFAREAAEWAGQTVLLVGAGHSAQTAARDLAELARQAPDTRVVWALRGAEPDWGAQPGDPLPERARLTEIAAELAAGTSPAVEVSRGVSVEALKRKDSGAEVVLKNGASSTLVVDRILALTGYVGDHELYRQLQIHECYATCGPIKLSAALLGAGAGDCLAQTSHGAETLTNPEPGFFILGCKSYGRNNTFLMRVGWQQVDEIFGALGVQGSLG